MWVDGARVAARGVSAGVLPASINLGADGDTKVDFESTLVIDGYDTPLTGIHLVRVEVPNGRAIEMRCRVEAVDDQQVFVIEERTEVGAR